MSYLAREISDNRHGPQMEDLSLRHGYVLPSPFSKRQRLTSLNNGLWIMEYFRSGVRTDPYNKEARKTPDRNSK